MPNCLCFCKFLVTFCRAEPNDNNICYCLSLQTCQKMRDQFWQYFSMKVLNFGFFFTGLIQFLDIYVWLTLEILFFGMIFRRNLIVLVWIPSRIIFGYHLDTICRYHLHTIRIPAGYQLDSTWIPPGHHLDTTWIPPGYHLDTTWIPPGYHY